MSIRSEIRAALFDGPKTTDELLPLVPSVEGDRVKLSANMSTLSGSQMVRRAGLSDDGKPLYQINPAQWPAKAKAKSKAKPPEQKTEGAVAPKSEEEKAGKVRKAAPTPDFIKPCKPDAVLAAITGEGPMPRTEVTSRVWAYIKKHGLQDKVNKRMINADEKLKVVFDGEASLSMFDMTKAVSAHLVSDHG